MAASGEEPIRRIVDAYEKGQGSHRQLAERFDVSHTTVGRPVRQ